MGEWSLILTNVYFYSKGEKERLRASCEDHNRHWIDSKRIGHKKKSSFAPEYHEADHEISQRRNHRQNHEQIPGTVDPPQKRMPSDKPILYVTTIVGN